MFVSAGRRAGVVCTVFAQRTTGRFATAEERHRAEDGLVATGLESLHVLAAMDAQRSAAGERHWRPSHWRSAGQGPPDWTPARASE